MIYDADIEAAREYARRWRKGLPSDRWADGHVGSVMVARGIEKLAIALADHIIAERQRGVDAMSTGEPEYGPHPVCAGADNYTQSVGFSGRSNRPDI